MVNLKIYFLLLPGTGFLDLKYGNTLYYTTLLIDGLRL